MAEFHPYYDLHAGYAYFHKEEADIDEEDTYSENCPGVKHKVAVWTHPLSDVINALIKVGLTIKKFREFDYSPYDCFEGMSEEKEGHYVLKKGEHNIPLVYSILATKES